MTTPTGMVRIDRAPPWRREHASASARREAMLAFGRECFDTEFLDFIPLESAPGGIDGVAFVLPQATVTAARRSDRVYLKGMLLTDKADELLPSWAFFVKAVLDVRDLRPLASRESFVHDATLESAREVLGDGIAGWLRELARNDRERLHALLMLHHHPIKQLAEEDAEFLRMVGPWLPFETTAGAMRLEDYLAKERSIRLAPTVDTFRQIAPLVSAQGGIAINAGYSHDLAILERWAAMTGLPIERVDASALADSFADVDLAARETLMPLLRVADAVLQPFRCSAQVKRFAPATLPAIYVASEDTAFVRRVERTKEATDSLWSSVLDDLATTRRSAPGAKLTFNYDNPLVRRIARIDDREMLRRLVEVLYVQTLLLGHHPLSGGEMHLVNEGLTGLIELVLESGGSLLQ